MSYELAKRLKDAGWPSLQVPMWEQRSMRWPTLSELIEACGDKFGSLDQWDRERGSGWIVHGHRIIWDSNEPGHIRIKSSTPIEAVANLWLELNKKS